MDLAQAVAVVIARPLVHGVTDRAVVRVQTGVVGGLIGKQQGGVGRNAGSDNTAAGGLVGVLDNPAAHLAAVATDDRDDGWTVIVIRAASPLFVGSAARWVERVGVWRAFFRGIGRCLAAFSPPQIPAGKFPGTGLPG
jgi:hypothetical protein